jgi:hypothetical protein
MKRIFFLFCLLLSFSFSAFTQEKKDTVAAKEKHIFSISLLNELNYTNDTKLSFRDVSSDEHSLYSYSWGVTINWELNKYFSIGTGLINDRFYFLYNNTGGSGTTKYGFYFTGIPIIPDFFYNYRRFSFHLIPEIREDILTSAYIEDNGIKAEWRFGNGSLLLACPKFGISYNITKVFLLSAYFGIKYTLSPISDMYNGSGPLPFYAYTAGLGINYRF